MGMYFLGFDKPKAQKDPTFASLSVTLWHICYGPNCGSKNSLVNSYWFPNFWSMCFFVALRTFIRFLWLFTCTTYLADAARQRVTETKCCCLQPAYSMSTAAVSVNNLSPEDCPEHHCLWKPWPGPYNKLCREDVKSEGDFYCQVQEECDVQKLAALIPANFKYNPGPDLLDQDMY